ncbi:Flagellar biosynthesis protein FlhB [hydrothermal vent metagenome]|uniref:Flagellar biosynthesis protein FlhB n=1 Tax=hydrothermal vent metagenome TaxID=652676 RepID=A0A3B0XD98_9ZZZZ
MKHSTPIAVALEYDGTNTPTVNARGMGSVAEQIIEMAEQYGIPLQQDNELIEVLSDLKLGDEIPENLYKAIAEVIAFAYILSGKFPKNWQP